ncbi:MAG: hypothetical protein WBS24_15815 [Terriglobales bacterium]
MDGKSREQGIDRWLDDALSQYSKAEPREGFEGRVLAYLAEARRQPSRKLSWWGVFAFSAAAIIAIALLWHVRTGPTSLRQISAVNVIAPAKENRTNDQRQRDQSSVNSLRNNNSVFVTPEKAHRGNRANAIQPAALPELEQFPSRRNLSKEESLLARRLSGQSNKGELPEATETSVEADLNIDSLAIRPLQIPDTEISESKPN